MINLPKQFVRTIRVVHKEKAEKWLENFDMLITECENRWEIEIMSPFDLSYNFVAPAKQKDGTELVIKLVVPSEEFLAEVEALKLFNGRGIVKIMDVDSEKGILILERLIPGTTLASLENDEDSTHIASQVMRKLWMPAPISSLIPTTTQREKELLRIYKDYPEGIDPISIDILKEAIDPKGLIGDREYDVIQFLLNKLPTENLTAVIDKRINIFVEELGLDKNRILSWGFAHSVLETCWSIEEGNRYDEAFFKAISVFKHGMKWSAK